MKDTTYGIVFGISIPEEFGIIYWVTDIATQPLHYESDYNGNEFLLYYLFPHKQDVIKIIDSWITNIEKYHPAPTYTLSIPTRFKWWAESIVPKLQKLKTYIMDTNKKLNDKLPLYIYDSIIRSNIYEEVE